MNDPHDISGFDDPDETIDDLAARLGLGEVVAAFAETIATPPPSAERQRLMAAIRAQPRQPVAGAPVPNLYERRVAAMSTLLDELTVADWAAPAAPYRWPVHRLVAHLTVIEEYTQRQFGLTDLPPLPAGAPGVTSHLAVGTETIAGLVRTEPAVMVRRWRAAAENILGHVCSAAFEPAMPVPLHSWSFDASTALVARAFEIWTHADDIRRATGRPLDNPSPAELRTMSSTSVNGLPVLLAATGGPPMQPTRVVLTGAGGGTFDLGRTEYEVPLTEHLLVADVVDYCRLVARRVDPTHLESHRNGDEHLLNAILRAASAVAV